MLSLKKKKIRHLYRCHDEQDARCVIELLISSTVFIAGIGHALSACPDIAG